jgi:hypothetical protein
MAKRDRVPETTETRLNRAMRRHPEKLEKVEDAPVTRDVQEDILKTGGDDDASVRTKSSGHKKRTADKWNQ